MENEKLTQLYNKLQQYGFTTEGKYYVKKITKQIKMKIYFDYDNNKTENKIRSFTIIKENTKTKKEEKISFSLDDGTDVFGEITNAFEAFYYAFIEQEIKQVFEKEFFIPTDRKLTEEEKQKIREICKSQNILNYEDISKYNNALKDFEKIYNKTEAKEDDWQNFFQKYLWVLGLSLQQQLTIPSRPSSELKQDDMDASLMTSSNFRVIAEFKKHTESLLKNTKYRERNQENNNSLNDCYNASDDLSGGVIQVLQYKQSIKENFIKQKNKAGENAYEIANFNPKCYLIIGNTEELNDDGKKECFELFRRNCKDVEIITYDEIYEKIKYVVENMKDNNTEQTQTKEGTNNDYNNDIPF